MDREKTFDDVLKELADTLKELEKTVAGINRDLREILSYEEE